MSTWAERKSERRDCFERFVKGWRLRPCTACAGSGHYDHDGAPPCVACEGTGRERYRSMASEAKTHAGKDAKS